MGRPLAEPPAARPASWRRSSSTPTTICGITSSSSEVSADLLHGFGRVILQNLGSFSGTWRVECPHTSVTAGGSHTARRSEEHTSELQSQSNLVCRLLLEKKKKINESGGGRHLAPEQRHAILLCLALVNL